jgi:hypothetical protein
MGEQLYFVRKRGEISGPFSIAQLQSLHARGQFGRFNEVSLDRVHWSPAASVAGVFSSPPPPPPPGPAPAPTVLPGATAPTVRESTPAASWYYLDRGEERHGPVSLDDLQRLLDEGEVSPTTYASQPGMPEWIELRSLPGLSMPRRAGRASTPGAALRAWLLAALVGMPTVGCGLIGLLAWLAVDSFLNDRHDLGVLYAFLALIVFVLAGVGTVLVAVVYRRMTTTGKPAGEVRPQRSAP